MNLFQDFVYEYHNDCLSKTAIALNRILNYNINTYIRKDFPLYGSNIYPCGFR